MKPTANYEKGDVRITAMRLVREVRNCMCHNFYYEAKYRLYTDASHFYRGNFVVWFDTEDLAEEYPEKERYSRRDIKDYALSLAYCFMDNAPRKEINDETMRPFYEACHETMERCNGMLRRWAS